MEQRSMREDISQLQRDALHLHNRPHSSAPSPIASTAAFAHFQQEHADRREGPVDQQTADLVGAYITNID